MKNDEKGFLGFVPTIMHIHLWHIARETFYTHASPFNTSQSFRSFIFLADHLISIEFVKFISTQNPWCSWSLFEVRARLRVRWYIHPRSLSTELRLNIF